MPTLSRENYYIVRSPALSLILYAEDKYAVGETGTSPIELRLSRELQFTIGEMMANKHGATQHYSPREDVDAVLVKGKKGYGLTK